MSNWHITRRWGGGDKAWFGDRCPCAEAPCGYVTPDQDCPEHGGAMGKTIRGGHEEAKCTA